MAGTAKGIASHADILRDALRGPAPRISSLKEFQNYHSYYFIIILFIVACNFYLHILPSGSVIFPPQGILLRTFKFLELDKLEKMENILYLS